MSGATTGTGSRRAGAKPKRKPLVLVFDDEVEFASALRSGLELHGCEVAAFTHPDDAIRFVRRQLPDVAVLDVIVDSPACASSNDGITLYQNIRAHERNLRSKGLLPRGTREVLIYFLTNSPKVDRRIEVLPTDVRDYLRKPTMPPQQLSARILADCQTRRSRRGRRARPATPARMAVSTGAPRRDQPPLVVHDDGCLWHGYPVQLTDIQLEIVRLLVLRKGTVKPRGELVAALGRAGYNTGSSDLVSHVKRIRRAFHRVDPEFGCIETEYGVGYRWHEG